MTRRLCLVGLTFVVCSTLVSAQGAAVQLNLLLGTWKQNLAKSTYNPGPPPTFVSVRQYAAGDAGSIVAVTMTISPDGLPSLGAVAAANYDGKDYVQHTLATLASSLASHVEPTVDRTISYTLTDPYTVEIVIKQGGRVVSRATRTISRDGKSMTERSTSTDGSGRPVVNVLVFEKQ